MWHLLPHMLCKPHFLSLRMQILLLSHGSPLVKLQQQHNNSNSTGKNRKRQNPDLLTMAAIVSKSDVRGRGTQVGTLHC